MELSVVIPCYRSSKTIEDLYGALSSQLPEITGSWEVVFVNDCSPDDTVLKLREISKQDPHVTVVDLMYNVGQFRALMAGFEHCSGEYVITMDDDLQHPPSEIKTLYTALRDNPDLDAMFGKYQQKAHSLFRNTGSFFIRKVNEIMFGKPKHLTMSAFRCLRRELIETLVSHRTISPVMGPLILKSTSRIENVPVRHDKRAAGSSTYSLTRLVRTTMDNILNFSALPLQIVGMTGMAVSLFSFFISLFFLVKYLLVGIGVPGWTSMFLLMNIYFGLVLFALGITGEYLIRIIREVRGDPRYRVRRVYRSGDDNQGDNGK